jgi:hypothetical protein
VTGSTAAIPRDGDVVIARDAHDHTRYTLTVIPGSPQVRYPSFDTALAVATEWASRMPVSLWLTEDGRIFTALEISGRRKA